MSCRCSGDHVPGSCAPASVVSSQTHDGSAELGAYQPWQQYPGPSANPCGDLELFDPVIRAEPGLITRETRVGSIGSCFAESIKSWLIKRDFSFVQKEDGPGATAGSARYGYVFSSAVLAQIAQYAFGSFDFSEQPWRDGERLLDPYRYGVAWPSLDDVEAERAAHAAAVREAFTETQVLICTMGLSESWRSKIDGSALAFAPPANVYDSDRHECVLLSPEDNLANMERFYNAVRAHNPSIRLVVSVSPVALRASIHPLGPVVGNSVSKASLRSAVDMFCRRHPEVVYFPSYEIVTALSPSWAFRSNHRYVKRSVVDRIMRTFMKHFGPQDESFEQPAQSPAVSPAASYDRGLYETAFRVAYLAERWKRIGEATQGRPVAIYGGGQHTRSLLKWMLRVSPRPSIEVILDDFADTTEVVRGVPFRRPADVDPSGYAAVIVSSDSIEARLADSARAWATRAPEGREPTVYTLYESVPRGPYLDTWEASQMTESASRSNARPERAA